MQILGLTFDKISIEMKNPLKGKLELKSNLKVEDITEQKLNISDKPALKFDFSFSVNYDPNIAVVNLKGSLVALDNKNESKEILKEWKDKKFNHPSKIAILNQIMNKCNIKAIQLEDEFNLPLHINLPKIKPASQKSSGPANYTG